MTQDDYTHDDIQDPAFDGGSAAPAEASQTAGGPDGQDTADDTVPRAELLKVIRQRQAAKDRARRAEARLGDADDDLPDQLDALRGKLRRRDAQLAELVRRRSLRDAAEAAGAVNPDQVVAMLKERVVAAEADDGEMNCRCVDDRGELLRDDQGRPAGVETLVAGFLANPANANLLRPTTAPGSGAHPSGYGAADDPGSLSLGTFNALPPDRRRRAAMAMSRSQRERMLGLGRTVDSAYL